MIDLKKLEQAVAFFDNGNMPEQNNHIIGPLWEAARLYLAQSRVTDAEKQAALDGVIQPPEKVTYWSTGEEAPFYQIYKNHHGVYLRIAHQNFAVGGNYDADGVEYTEKHKDFMVKQLNKAITHLVDHIFCNPSEAALMQHGMVVCDDCGAEMILTCSGLSTYPAGEQTCFHIPNGWKLVPIEPTVQQVTEGAYQFAKAATGDGKIKVEDIYKAMIAAAPENE